MDRLFCKNGDLFPNIRHCEPPLLYLGGEAIPRDYNLMSKLKNLFNSKWIFIIPSILILGLFVLPLFAVFVRSINSDFFKYAFSEQALTALQLSLVTSTITTLGAIVFGTPLAYILARWKN